MRAQPPGFARHETPRRSVFNAAMEQAEQLFRGAEALEPSTRPSANVQVLGLSDDVTLLWLGRNESERDQAVREYLTNYPSLSGVPCLAMRGGAATYLRVTDAFGGSKISRAQTEFLARQ